MGEGKTVYILGAGTSKAFGLPLQAELLNKIFTLQPSRPINSDLSFMELEINQKEQNVIKYLDEFEKQRQRLSEFVVENFAPLSERAEFFTIINQNAPGEGVPLSDNWMRAYNIAANINVTLEDLFTLFDKIIIGREHFRIYAPAKIEEIHTALRKCIIFTLSYESAINESVSTAQQKLADKLLNLRQETGVKDDTIAIITMNWDSMLERELFTLCQGYNKTIKKPRVFPDLCFYDYCFNDQENRIVSTQIKAKGHKNIKFLKLHGSINWLICPYCGRVYVDYDYDIAINELSMSCVCPSCKDESDNIDTAPQLRSMLITPTYLKDLNNLHLKNIWHNALIDLTEASKLVFIGYSFPDADFEMRCLMKKAIRPQTSIEVVLHSSDNPEYYREVLKKHRFSKKNIDIFMRKLNLPESRYTSFFGANVINFSYDGLEAFLQNSVEEFQ